MHRLTSYFPICWRTTVADILQNLITIDSVFLEIFIDLSNSGSKSVDNPNNNVNIAGIKIYHMELGADASPQNILQCFLTSVGGAAVILSGHDPEM
jgi:hypothetical protein